MNETITYYQENRDKAIAYQKEYRERNKDKVKEDQRRWREKNKEKISQYRKIKYATIEKFNPKDIERRRKYYEEHKEITRSKQNKRNKERRQNDPREYLFRIVKNILSKRRNELLTITIDDIVIPEMCPYFGVKLSADSKEFYPSVDRIDSSKGYQKDNIQIISSLANLCKNSLSISDLVTFAKNVINIHEKNIPPNSETMLQNIKTNTDARFYCKRINKLFQKAQCRAKEGNKEFNISIDDIIVPRYCPYLGYELKFKDLWVSPTIDRIDNTKGYIKGNVQIISYQANTCKNNVSISELIVFAKNVLRLHDKTI